MLPVLLYYTYIGIASLNLHTFNPNHHQPEVHELFRICSQCMMFCFNTLFDVNNDLPSCEMYIYCTAVLFI